MKPGSVRRTRQSVRMSECSVRVVLNRLSVGNSVDSPRQSGISGSNTAAIGMQPPPQPHNRQSLPASRIDTINQSFGQLNFGRSTPAAATMCEKYFQNAITDLVSTLTVNFREKLGQFVEATETQIQYEIFQKELRILNERHAREIAELKSQHAKNVAAMMRKHQANIAEVKKKQWCEECGAERSNRMRFYCDRACERKFMYVSCRTKQSRHSFHPFFAFDC